MYKIYLDYAFDKYGDRFRCYETDCYTILGNMIKMDAMNLHSQYFTFQDKKEIDYKTISLTNVMHSYEEEWRRLENDN